MSRATASGAVAAVLLALLSGALSWNGSHHATALLGEAKLRGGFAWFGEPLRIQRFVDHELDQELLSVTTPFEPLMARAPVRAWMRVLPGEPLQVIRGFTALTAALWAALVFLALVALGCRLPDAVLFTVVGIASAAAQVWFAVPAAAALGSVSTFVAILVVVWSPSQHGASGWQTTLAVIAAVSVRAVNGVFGVVAAGLAHGWRRGLQLTVNGLAVLLLLWPVQRILYPTSGPLPDPVSAAPARVLTAIIDAAFVPVYAIAVTDGAATLTMGLGHSWVGLLGAAAWLAVLGLGASHLASSQPRLGTFLAMVLGARLLAGWWHTEPAFHAALDILPLALIAGAAATLTSYRWTSRSLGVIVLAAMLLNQRTAIAVLLARIGGLE